MFSLLCWSVCWVVWSATAERDLVWKILLFFVDTFSGAADAESGSSWAALLPSTARSGTVVVSYFPPVDWFLLLILFLCWSLKSCSVFSSLPVRIIMICGVIVWAFIVIFWSGWTFCGVVFSLPDCVRNLLAREEGVLWRSEVASVLLVGPILAR